MNTIKEKIKAKIPGNDTGIEIKHSICDICSPGVHCGVDCYVKDGKIIKIEGTPGFIPNQGTLCTKGAVGRQYVYQKNRIQHPMKRVGTRGSGQFEAISWDEAFRITAEALNKSKSEYGPEATAFLCGYTKWYRTFFHRLAYSFGSPNYITESSTCYQSGVIANMCTLGSNCSPDFSKAKLLIIWGQDIFTKSVHMGRQVIEFRKKGGIVVTIDPRINSMTERVADFKLRPRLGTDGYLALAIANYLITNDLYDKDFVGKYVHGFEEYKKYVNGFSLEGAASATGIPLEDIKKLADLWAETDPSVISIGNGIAHHANGFNTIRAILSLMVIMGRFDRPGTLKPGTGPATFCYSFGGFQSKEPMFINSVKPKNAPPEVGKDRFPMFVEKMHEGHGMELAKQILAGRPYPIKTAFFAGVNYLMYPDTETFREAISKLDFIAASDLFWTESCKNADIVFPACSSFERSEIKCYANKFIYYTSPAIEPLYESRSDFEIFRGLAKALNLNDKLLEVDYDTCARFILEEKSGITDWENFKNSDRPIVAPAATPYIWGSSLEKGLRTPTGKLELYSETIAAYHHENMNPLIDYVPNPDNADSNVYDMTMCSGARNHGMIHSRLHGCSWSRSVKPGPTVDINPADASRLGINSGDKVRLSTPIGSIETFANVTETTSVGELQMYHGYEESNINQIINGDVLDPYSGFPSYKQFRCRIEKVQE